MSRRIVKLAFGAAIAFTFVLGLAALYSPAEAAPRCICPDIYAPVTCSNGKTYSNLCVATCHHATDCVAGNTI